MWLIQKYWHVPEVEWEADDIFSIPSIALYFFVESDMRSEYLVRVKGIRKNYYSHL
jgi:hypothetical protein